MAAVHGGCTGKEIKIVWCLPRTLSSQSHISVESEHRRDTNTPGVRACLGHRTSAFNTMNMFEQKLSERMCHYPAVHWALSAITLNQIKDSNQYLLCKCVCRIGIKALLHFRLTPYSPQSSDWSFSKLQPSLQAPLDKMNIIHFLITPAVSPSLWSRLKYPNKYWMDCHEMIPCDLPLAPPWGCFFWF